MAPPLRLFFLVSPLREAGIRQRFALSRRSSLLGTWNAARADAFDRCGLPRREPPPLGYFAETFRDAKGMNHSFLWETPRAAARAETPGEVV
jgi:hypothetical protein